MCRGFLFPSNQDFLIEVTRYEKINGLNFQSRAKESTWSIFSREASLRPGGLSAPGRPASTVLRFNTTQSSEKNRGQFATLVHEPLVMRAPSRLTARRASGPNYSISRHGTPYREARRLITERSPLWCRTSHTNHFVVHLTRESMLGLCCEILLEASFLFMHTCHMQHVLFVLG